MISNIHTTYLKGEKAFNNKKFTEAKKHLISVIEHDTNYYAAYLLLFEILNTCFFLFFPCFSIISSEKSR